VVSDGQVVTMGTMSARTSAGGRAVIAAGIAAVVGVVMEEEGMRRNRACREGMSIWIFRWERIFDCLPDRSYIQSLSRASSNGCTI
jgi:hypothetical protein